MKEEQKKKGLFGDVMDKVGQVTNDAVKTATPVATKFVKDSADKLKETVVSNLDSKNETDGSIGAVASKTLNDVSSATVSAISDTTAKTRDAVVSKIDVNGNGEVDIEDIIILGLTAPGIRVSRADFLRRELRKTCTDEQIELAIKKNPIAAGINTEIIDKIADDVIQFERNCVSGISAALSSVGGVAMAATIPSDIVQYYGYMLRTAQKLLYLYGFPEIDVEKNKEGIFDSATINLLTISLGTMYGVGMANAALKAMAEALGKGVEKQLLKKALTKGAIYPIVKSVAKWFNVKMTKDVFAGFFKKAIPLVGGVIGGGITYLTFKPCCDKLKIELRDTALSNPNYKSDVEEKEIFDMIQDEIE